jgi:hypothetical protein
MRANRGIPHDLEGEGKHLKKEKSVFRRNGDIMVQVWNKKTCANDAPIVNKGRKVSKTNMEIKKPYAVGQCNKFIKGVDRANQYLSFYTGLRKTVKSLKKVVLFLLNRALFNAFFEYTGH